MFFGIKKKIMLSNINKRKKAGYDMTASELFTLGPEDDGHINNSYFFVGHSMEGETIYIRLGLRGDGSKETWFGWYKDGRFVELTRELYGADEESPLKVECITPGESWHVTFEGKMRDVAEKNRREYDAKMDITFTATAKIVDFFYDNDPTTTANAIAAEKWSKGLFEEIQKNNQRHYEQAGRINGTFVLEGEEHALALPAARDHSFGPRYWSYMNRHFWILAVDEGGNVMNISMVSYPAVDEIWTGYTTMFGGVDSFASVKSATNMDKAGHGDGKMVVEITLTNGKSFTVETKRDAEAIYHFDNGTYYFSEGLGSMIIDGKPCRGTIEFSYNGDESRWKDR